MIPCNPYQLYDGSGQRQGCVEMSVGFARLRQYASSSLATRDRAVNMLSGTDARAVLKKRNIGTSSFDCNTGSNQTTLSGFSDVSGFNVVLYQVTVVVALVVMRFVDKVQLKIAIPQTESDGSCSTIW